MKEIRLVDADRLASMFEDYAMHAKKSAMHLVTQKKKFAQIKPIKRTWIVHGELEQRQSQGGNRQ